MVIEQKVEAIDPVRLAQLSGITKVPRFAAPTPPVVRPFLLTSQLRGCSCHEGMGQGYPNYNLGHYPAYAEMGVPPDYGRLRGLGFDVPELIAPDPNSFDINNLQVPSQVQGTGTPGNISVLQTIALGANFVPGVGQIASVALSTFASMLNQFESWFHIGAGRREADIITPVQNNLVVNNLGAVTNEILSGNSVVLDELLRLYHLVWTYAVSFQEFVLMRNFTDRRASGQALNTVMPYLDGSCGYSVPIPFTATPTQFNCLTWGAGTLGGPGSNGMLGALGRAIVNAGGSVPVLPDIHQTANSGIKPASVPLPGGLPATILGVSTPLAFGIGILALMMYKKGLF